MSVYQLLMYLFYKFWRGSTSYTMDSKIEQRWKNEIKCSEFWHTKTVTVEVVYREHMSISGMNAFKIYMRLMMMSQNPKNYIDFNQRKYSCLPFSRITISWIIDSLHEVSCLDTKLDRDYMTMVCFFLNQSWQSTRNFKWLHKKILFCG